jgi:hypothetical protein
MALLEEFTYCYGGVSSSLITLNPLDSDDLAIMNDITSNILPSIQTIYNNSVSSLTSYYNNIQENMMKKASACASSTDYAATLRDGCNFIRDIRSGGIFARIKAYVMRIIIDGIKAVVNLLKQSILDAIADLALMVDISGLDDLMRDVNQALGTCAAILGQGAAFLGSVMNCLADTGLYNPKLASGITKIQSLMAQGGGQILNKAAALNSIRSEIMATADIKGQSSNLLNKLQNVSYRKLGI